MASHTSNDSNNSKTTHAMSSNDGERITSRSRLQAYKKEFRGTPTVAAVGGVVSDCNIGDARIPSMDGALRIGSSSFTRYQSDVSAPLVIWKRISMPELITSSRSVHEMDVNRISTIEIITKELLDDKVQTEASHLSPQPADKQAVEREYVDTIGEWDILCGRGGKANHHSGNKRYRWVVSEMKATYRDTAVKRSDKTNLSKDIVECVSNYGARFLKEDKEGHYFVMSKAEARKKTSQALREIKQYKWANVRGR